MTKLMNTKRNYRSCRRLFFIPITLTFLCILGFGLSALSNRYLPSHSTVADRLADLDKARAAEALHLRRELGRLAVAGMGHGGYPDDLLQRRVRVPDRFCGPSRRMGEDAGNLNPAADRGRPFRMIPSRGRNIFGRRSQREQPRRLLSSGSGIVGCRTCPPRIGWRSIWEKNSAA